MPDEFTFHWLRHDFASRCISGGMPLPHVSRILGHASTATTERVYWHMLRGSVSAARRVLDEGYRKLGYTPGVSVSAM